jgi:hypothetical protein
MSASSMVVAPLGLDAPLRANARRTVYFKHLPLLDQRALVGLAVVDTPDVVGAVWAGVDVIQRHPESLLRRGDAVFRDAEDETHDKAVLGVYACALYLSAQNRGQCHKGSFLGP